MKMNDFLLQIDGLSSENLTSEVLKFILTNDNYSIYQRLFYNYLLDNSANLDSFELKFEITTQEKFPQFGIPDILIRNENQVYIIENKFYAPYSGENQISRYYKILTNYYSDYDEKIIFLLTIKSRAGYYQKLINDDIKKNIQNKSNIKIKYKFWEDILRLFKSNDVIIQNLTNYIKEKYLTNIIFSREEMNILKDKKVAEALQKIFDYVVRVKEILSSRDYKTRRLGQSYQFYGFFIEIEKVDVWFGYFLSAWTLPHNNTYTPLYAQIELDWIKIDNPDMNFDNKLKQLGFFKHPDFGWLKPFDIDNNLDLLISELTYCLDEIKKQQES